MSAVAETQGSAISSAPSDVRVTAGALESRRPGARPSHWRRNKDASPSPSPPLVASTQELGDLRTDLLKALDDHLDRHSRSLLTGVAEQLDEHLSAVQMLLQAVPPEMPRPTSPNMRFAQDGAPHEEMESVMSSVRYSTKDTTTKFQRSGRCLGSEADEHQTNGLDMSNMPSELNDPETRKRQGDESWDPMDAAQLAKYCVSSRTSLALHMSDRLQELDDASLSKSLYASFLNRLARCMALEEPKRTGFVARLVLSKNFAFLSGMVIMLNAALIVHTTNQSIETLSEETGKEVVIFEWFFLFFYLFELIARLSVHRWFFFWCEDIRWNLLDFMLVVLALYEQLVATNFGVKVTFMRSLRVMKMAKILRVIRLMRVFSELRLMLNSVMGSLVNLFWSFNFLGFVFFLFGLAFVQASAQHLKTRKETDGSMNPEIYLWFGSVEQAMLSLYIATTNGEDWNVIYKVIHEMGVMPSILWIFFIAFFQIALVNILTGLFVENAMKLAQPDRDTLAMETRKKEANEFSQMRRLCQEMDLDNSGTVSASEFRRFMQRGKLKGYMRLLGLDVKDAENFFEMLAAYEPGAQVPIEAFITGCMRLKGNATSIDLQTLAWETKLMHKEQMAFFEYLTSLLEQSPTTPNGRSRLSGRGKSAESV